MVHSPVRRQSGTAVTPQESAQNDFAYQRTLAQRSQQADARKNFVDKLAMERQRALLPKAQGGLGMLEGSLPRIDDQTRDADIVAAAKQYAALHGNKSAFSPDGGLRPPPQPAGSAIDSAAQPAQFAGFKVTPEDRAADIRLGQQFGAFNHGTTLAGFDAGVTPPIDAASVAQGQKAAANPGVAQSRQLPNGDSVSVRMPTWQENLVKQYPEIGKAGTAANDAFVKAFKAGGVDPTKAAGIAANIYGAKAQDPTAPGGAAYQSPIVAADGTSKLNIGASTAPGSAGAAPGQAVAPVNFAGFDVGPTDLTPPDSGATTVGRAVARSGSSALDAIKAPVRAVGNTFAEAGNEAANFWRGINGQPSVPFVTPFREPASTPSAPSTPMAPYESTTSKGVRDSVATGAAMGAAGVMPRPNPVSTPAPTPAGVDASSPIAIKPYNWSTPSGGASKSLSLGPNIEPGPQNMINAGSSSFALGDKKKKSLLDTPTYAGF